MLLRSDTNRQLRDWPSWKQLRFFLSFLLLKVPLPQIFFYSDQLKQSVSGLCKRACWRWYYSRASGPGLTFFFARGVREKKAGSREYYIPTTGFPSKLAIFLITVVSKQENVDQILPPNIGVVGSEAVLEKELCGPPSFVFHLEGWVFSLCQHPWCKIFESWRWIYHSTHAQVNNIIKYQSICM